MICEQEDCEFWNGEGCVCQWMDYSGLDRSFDDHAGMGQ